MRMIWKKQFTWPRITPEALNNNNRRWSPAKREAEPAGRRTPCAQPRQGLNKRKPWIKPLFNAHGFVQPLPGLFIWGHCAAGSASRFAGLHRRLFLFHASGVLNLEKLFQLELTNPLRSLRQKHAGHGGLA